MRRAFDVDVQGCPNCDGRLRLIVTIVDPRTIRALLLSLGVHTEVPERAPHPCSAPPPDPSPPILTRDPVP
jgi:hypothetical protein